MWVYQYKPTSVKVCHLSRELLAVLWIAFLQKSLSKAELKAMSAMVDHNGRTPLLIAVEAYKDWTVSFIL